MMLPLCLDVRRLKIVLAGDGPAACRRLALLDAAGAGQVTVYTETGGPDLAEAAGDRLVRRLPEPADLADTRLLLVAGLADAAAARLTAVARAMGILVNVEDRRSWCDVHMPAVIRRCDLVLTVSTNGRSPGLARRLKRFLEALFGPEWATRVDEVANRRARWREDGADTATLGRLTDELVARRGWLPRIGRQAGAKHP